MKDRLSAIFAAAILTAAGANPAAAQDVQTYQVDPVHSAVVFHIKHMNLANIWGRFNEMSGTLTLEDGAPADLDMTVKAGSIDTGNTKRDDHLRSPDFFDAKQFPEITFDAKSIEPVEGQENIYDVTGDLTLHGVTKSVTIPLTFFGSGTNAMNGQPIAAAQAEFAVHRADFGMTKFLPDAVGNEVALIAAIEANQPEE